MGLSQEFCSFCRKVETYFWDILKDGTFQVKMKIISHSSQIRRHCKTGPIFPCGQNLLETSRGCCKHSLGGCSHHFLPFYQTPKPVASSNNNSEIWKCLNTGILKPNLLHKFALPAWTLEALDHATHPIKERELNTILEVLHNIISLFLFFFPPQLSTFPAPHYLILLLPKEVEFSEPYSLWTRRKNLLLSPADLFLTSGIKCH